MAAALKPSYQDGNVAEIEFMGVSSASSSSHSSPPSTYKPEMRRQPVDVADKKITPTQQIISSCFGAISTSFVGWYLV